ncbi:MAG: hypothetical protein J7M32_09240 [Deltaproteobacteria bacterium]|nr:hypothetical protein [Deltaproteobacteria bacterium]
MAATTRTTHATKPYTAEFRPRLPWIVGMLGDEELDNEKDKERDVKTPEENLDVPGVVEEIFFG